MTELVVNGPTLLALLQAVSLTPCSTVNVAAEAGAAIKPTDAVASNSNIFFVIENYPQIWNQTQNTKEMLNLPRSDVNEKTARHVSFRE